jgi:hypothetical protein
MVLEMKSHAYQMVELFLAGRQETDIQIRALQFQPVSLGRIKRLKSLGDVLCLVGIIQTFSQNDLAVLEVTAILIIYIAHMMHIILTT